MAKHQPRLFIKRQNVLSVFAESLEAITTDEMANKELLGTAYGADLYHCVWLGSKHCPDLHKAKWYYVFEGSDEHLEALRQVQPQTQRIDFYAPPQEETKGGKT